MKLRKKKTMAPQESMALLPTGFMILILVGAILLMLPCSTVPGEETTFLTALFTSTTSVCVTGSVVVDTCTHWTLFGKFVILGLIQLGGLGIIVAVVFLVFIARHRFTLGQILMLKDMYTLDSSRGVLHFFKRIFLGTLIAEALGAIGFMPVFCEQFGMLRGIWYSFFTAVSAFCNAGITIIDPTSLEEYSETPSVMIVTMILIVAGGLGYLVWADLIAFALRLRDKSVRLRYSLHLIKKSTKIVLALTAGLIAGGAALIFAFEYGNPGTIGNMSHGGKIINCIFESVTFRTAGFSTVPQQNLTEETCLIGDILMFIGGSPLGTAGGVKTVTMFVLLMNVWSFLQDKEDVVLLKRTVPSDVVRKATAIISVQMSAVVVLTLALMLVTNAELSESLFEIMSAVCTVGLSRGLTPLLPAAGQWVVIIGMFIGRIGPISMLLFFQTGKKKKDGVRYADGRYIVG